MKTQEAPVAEMAAETAEMTERREIRRLFDSAWDGRPLTAYIMILRSCLESGRRGPARPLSKNPIQETPPTPIAVARQSV